MQENSREPQHKASAPVSDEAHFDKSDEDGVNEDFSHLTGRKKRLFDLRLKMVASATATFGMMFSSSLSVVEFYLLKRFPIPYTCRPRRSPQRSEDIKVKPKSRINMGGGRGE